MADDFWSNLLDELPSNLSDLLTGGENPGGIAGDFLDTVTGNIVSAQDIYDMGMGDELPGNLQDLIAGGINPGDYSTLPFSGEPDVSGLETGQGGGMTGDLGTSGGSGIGNLLGQLLKGVGGLASRLGGAAGGGGGGGNASLGISAFPTAAMAQPSAIPGLMEPVPAPMSLGALPSVGVPAIAMPNMPQMMAPNIPIPSVVAADIPNLPATGAMPAPLDLAGLLAGGGQQMMPQRLSGMQRLLMESRG